MSEEMWVILVMIVGVCTAVAVACWATASGLPLFGLMFLQGIGVRSKSEKS